MSDTIDASIAGVAVPREETRRKAPTIWEQFAGVFTEPSKLFQRLGDAPRWGQALWLIIAVGWVMMLVWGTKVDVDALQRPILEQNTQVTASQIDQAIEISRRFIVPMALVSLMIRNLLAVLSLGLVFWLYGATTAESRKPSYLHAVSAATVPNLVLIPYTVMIGIVCLMKPIGGQIPERLAPSGLAYYLHPQSAKLYGFLAQFDPFVIAYYAMLYLAVRYTMRLKRGDALLCTVLAVVLTTAWKVYFWV